MSVAPTVVTAIASADEATSLERPPEPGGRELETEARAKLLARQGVGMLSADRLRVVDKKMDDVAADAETMGEIVMRGNNVMNGYFADEEAIAEAFRGGWLHSGDLGVMNQDGYVELRDRANDVVISAARTFPRSRSRLPLSGN